MQYIELNCIGNETRGWELTVSADAHNHENVVAKDPDPLIRNKRVEVTTDATGLFRTSWAGLVVQRRGLVVSASIEEKEGVVGWLLENEVNQEPENVDHNDEDPKRIEIEPKPSVHPGSYPVNGVCVGASLEDVDGETDLAEKKEWLER